LLEGKRKFGWVAECHVTQKFRFGETGFCRRADVPDQPRTSMKYAFPVDNKICTQCSFDPAMGRATAAEQHKSTKQKQAESLIGFDLI
jgi:hypothetical protein